MISPARCLAFICVLWTALHPPLSSAADSDGEDAFPYQQLTRPALPRVLNDDWAQNPIDCFVLAELERNGLTPSAEADRTTLLKRVVYDLTGLAPTPAERAAFLNDASPGAYERLVDRLLASPHYGERWAQHWLDLVRYSESEGFKLDSYREDAWRYRDYVIRAFNADMPYDRFMQQQIAGDELEPNNPDALIATGFLRLHLEESAGANYRQIRQDILDDITEVTGLAFMGLTIGCARCHDHKFDPVSHEDYFQFQAFFAGLLPRDDAPLLTPAEEADYRRKLAVWERQTAEVRAEIAKLLARVKTEVFDETVVALDPDTQAALKTPDGERTPLQKQLAAWGCKQIDRRYAKMHRRLTGADKTRYEELKKKLDSFEVLKPDIGHAMAVAEVGVTPPATHRLMGGDYRRARKEVQPEVLECLDEETPDIKPGPRSSGRRSALAHWLSEPDHPLTSRVIVNRLWQHHFGQGIVNTPSDFGVKGEKPTHPQLLDWLASELVANGWRLKAIHRLIVTSATYRQASLPEHNPSAARAASVDSGNRLLWHQRYRRRDAESIRDTILQVSGALNPRMFGLSAGPELPPSLRNHSRAWDADEKLEDRNRRSVYVFNRRNLQYPLFAAFDAPNRVLSCAVRNATATAPQALLMLNGEFTVQQAEMLTARLLAKANGNQDFIRRAFLTILSREASPEEISRSELFLEQQAQRIGQSAQPQLHAAQVDFCHALLNSAEFLFVD